MRRDTVTLSELSVMAPGQQDRRMDALVRSADRLPNGEISRLDAAILEYETRFGISTSDLRQRLADGEIDETADVCEWLMVAGVRERLVKRSSRVR